MLNINMQQHKPLRILVYEELRMLIMTGQIKPGTQRGDQTARKGQSRNYRAEKRSLCF